MRKGVISGYLRCFKENIDNLKKYILNLHNIDIYIHITTCNENKYNNMKLTQDDVNNLLNPKIMITSSNFQLHEDPVINNVLNQNYKYYILNEERKRCEKNVKKM